MRRSLVAIPIALVLILGVPGLASAGHKYRIKLGTTRYGAKQFVTYTMVGKLPFGHRAAADRATEEDCLSLKSRATADSPLSVSVVYVGKGQAYQSKVAQVATDDKFEAEVLLPTTPVTYKVRLRCALGLTNPAKATALTKLVTIDGSSDPYTMFRQKVPPSASELAGTGGSAVPLLLGGTALIVLGGLLLFSERRLTRTEARRAVNSPGA